MAYAGTFKINTTFETRDANSQILRLTNEIKKTEAEISRLQAKMSSMKDAKIPTYEYQEMQKELQRAEENADKLYGKLRLLEKSGDTSSKGYRKLVNEINLADQQVNNLREGLSGLEAAGKAFIPGDMSLEFEKASHKVDELNGKLEVSKAKLNELLNKQGSTKGIFSRMQKAASGLLPVIKGIDQKFTSVFGRIRNAASKAFSSINKQGKKTGGIMSTLASRFKGIALSLLLFNWITKGFNAMISGAKAGLKNLEKYSNEYKQSIRDLQNALGTLRNSFAAAFAPIITAAVPYLIELINWVNRAVNALGQLFAYMTGHATWKKATEVQDAYKDALNGTAGAAKKAAGALAKFDDIDVLNKNTGGGGGGGSTGGFEEVPIDGAIKSFWDKIKKMWQDADFYDLGKALAEKINDMLESIDWSKVRETARKLGKSLATFLNGILENLDWHLLGVSIAQGINTAFEFAYGFVKNFNWQKFGEAIAETINGFMDGLDWELIAGTIITGAAGVAKSVMGFVRTLNWEQLAQTLANGINVAVDGLIAFLDGIDWGELGRSIGKFIINAIKDIDWKDIGRALGKILQNAFDFLAGIIGEMDYETFKQAIADFFEGFGEETKDIPDWVLNLAEAFLILKGAIKLLNTAIGGSKITSFLGGLKGALSWLKGINFAALLQAMNPGMIGEMGMKLENLLEGTFLDPRSWEGKAGEVYDAIDQFMTGLVDTIGSGITEAFKAIGTILTGTFNWDATFSVLDEAGKHFEKAFDGESIGKNILLGILKGFTGALGFIFEPIGDFFVTLFDAICSVFGIHSPATSMIPLGENIFWGIIEGFRNQFSSFMAVLSEWWDAYVMPWFTQERWTELLENIKIAFLTKWNEIVDWWQNTALYTWWEENVVPWFTQEKWAELIENIKIAFTEKWKEIKEDTTEQLENLKSVITEKYNNIKEKTDELKKKFDELKKNVKEAFDSAKNSVVDAVETMVEKIEKYIQKIRDAIQAVKDFLNSGYEKVGTSSEKTSKATSFARSVDPVSYKTAINSVPHLASGSVIRGGNPFLALLGDQPRGQMNVEAPAGLIKDMVKAGIAESGIGSTAGGVLQVVLNVNGADFARATLQDFLEEMKRQGLDVTVLGVP